MNNQAIQSYFARWEPVFAVVEAALDDLDVKLKDGECIPIPLLMTSLKIKFSWDDKQVNAKEPVIRDYFRDHPKWYVRQGAYGGIGRRAEKDKKDAVKQAKLQAKQRIEAELAKKLIDTTKTQTQAPDEEITLELAVISEVLSDTDAAE